MSSHRRVHKRAHNDDRDDDNVIYRILVALVLTSCVYLSPARAVIMRETTLRPYTRIKILHKFRINVKRNAFIVLFMTPPCPVNYK